MTSKSLLLALVGPCGAGKSTLAAALSEYPEVELIDEIAPRALCAGVGYRKLNMELIQRSFLRSRLEQVANCKAPIVIFDRSLSEDAEVFLRLHRELGGLSEVQFARLLAVARAAEESIGALDANIVLCAEEQVLRKRIAGRQRPLWLQDSFARQLELYQGFISRLVGPVLEVDTTHRSLEEVRSIALWIMETVRPASRGEASQSSRYGLTWRGVSSGASDQPKQVS